MEEVYFVLGGVHGIQSFKVALKQAAIGFSTRSRHSRVGNLEGVHHCDRGLIR